MDNLLIFDSVVTIIRPDVLLRTCDPVTNTCFFTCRQVDLLQKLIQYGAIDHWLICINFRILVLHNSFCEVFLALFITIQLIYALSYRNRPLVNQFSLLFNQLWH